MLKVLEKNSKNSNRLSLSNITFNNKNESVSNFMNKWTYKTNLTSPFASLSGIKDNGVLKNQKHIYLNVNEILYIDSKVLPLFNLDENLSDYAIRFLFCKSMKSCLNSFVCEGYLIGELFNFFKDFNLVLGNISKCFNYMAPINDPVKEIFSRLSYKFNKKYNDALALILDSEINLFEEMEKLSNL
ncbi:unnamed protein product [Brachionus calyciflorus]|uniref:Uncharacterized protein n=1 Tax=Brachionus calyciflorus TaxID=104777 RepID=A0A814C6F9_9BILA|nr:unnamed protein product [Brachionus calyciflorus]